MNTKQLIFLRPFLLGVLMWVGINHIQAQPIIACTDTTLCVEAVSCETDVFLPGPPTFSFCNDPQFTVNGDLPNLFFNANGGVTAINVPLGEYSIEYTAVDTCNFSSFCTQTLSIVDCTPPVSICEIGLAITLTSATTPFVLFPSDFNEGSYDNCTDEVFLSFSSDVNDVTLEVDCSDVGAPLTVELWVTDEAGNQNVCLTQLVVNEPIGGCCTGLTDYSGQVLVDTGDPLDSVDIFLNTNQNNFTQQTEADGLFSFEDLDCGQDATILAARNFGDPDDITVLDMIKLRNHILFIDILPPLRVEALDLNNSGGLSTFDLVLMNELVLQQPQANDLGYFFDPEVYVFNNVLGNITDVDFTAVRYGNAVYESEVPSTTTETSFYFPTDYEADPFFPFVEIPILVENFTDILGFQFEFSWNPDFLSLNSLDFVNVPIGVGGQYYVDVINPGRARLYLFTENPLQGMSISDGEAVAYLQFEAINLWDAPLFFEFPNTGYPAQVVYGPDCAVNQPITNAGNIVPGSATSTFAQNLASFWTVSPTIFTPGQTLRVENSQSNSSEVLVMAHDYQGRMIARETLPVEGSAWNLSTDHWPTGGILLSFWQNGQLLFTQKLVSQP